MNVQVEKSQIGIKNDENSKAITSLLLDKIQIV